MDVSERLLQYAKKEMEYSREYVFGLVEDPQFEHANRVHDWRNHVNSEVAEMWAQLSLESRIIAFLHAEEKAHNEYWE